MVSIAEAKNQLTAMIHQAETGQPIILSRRGKPVAVILSIAEYEGLKNAKALEPDGWLRLLAIRQQLAENQALVDWSDQDIRHWRDAAPGRPVVIE